MHKAWSYLNSLVAFAVLFLISPFSLQQSYYITYQVSLSTQHGNRWHTHTFCTHGLKTITTIYSFSFYSFLFGNCRVNIFINHITWHDAPKFTLSVYRNTLNRTQGFTMDTRLTFCPLHLQQWMTFSRFFVSFFPPLLPINPYHFADHIHQIRPPDKLTKAFYSAIAVEVFFLLYKHNMYRISTQTGYVS